MALIRAQGPLIASFVDHVQCPCFLCTVSKSSSAGPPARGCSVLSAGRDSVLGARDKGKTRCPPVSARRSPALSAALCRLPLPSNAIIAAALCLLIMYVAWQTAVDGRTVGGLSFASWLRGLLASSITFTAIMFTRWLSGCQERLPFTIGTGARVSPQSRTHSMTN